MLRKLEKATVQAAKKELDIVFWKRCIDLQLCPEFLKFKVPKIKQYRNVNKLYNSVITKSLEDTNYELKQVQIKLNAIKLKVGQLVSFAEKHMLDHVMTAYCKRFRTITTAVHTRKLLNLWLKQRSKNKETKNTFIHSIK